ncbi:MAG: energy transducer TonB [Balneolaceae bacterium]
MEDPVVLRGIGGGCDEEAIRVIKDSKFKPGMQRGRPVRVRYSIPLVFIIR